MRIALVVDNPRRDLFGLVLLAWYLAQKEGATSYLVPLNLQEQELSALGPDLALLNYLRTNNRPVVEQLLHAGVEMCVLDTEGQGGSEALAKTLPPEEEVRQQMAGFFCWGTKTARHVVEDGWFADEQVSVTGTPRMDFYDEAWREAALAAAPKLEGALRDVRVPLVLVNGNFPQGNPQGQPADRTLKQHLKDSEKAVERVQLVREFGYAPEDVKAMWWGQYENMHELAALTNTLATRYPAVSFLYRPHPFEKLGTYHDLLEERDNIFLSKEGTVDGWILRASAVIQRGCSTGLEAALAGVPSLCPDWFDAVTGMDETDALSVAYDAPEALAEGLGTILEGDFTLPPHVREARDEIERELFYKVDGRAHERVARAMVERLRGGGRSARGFAKGAAQQLRAVHYGVADAEVQGTARLGRHARKWLRLPARWSFRDWGVKPPRRWQASYKQFDAAQTRALMAAVCAAAGNEESGAAPVVEPAERGRDYRFGHEGQAVVVRPPGR